MARANPGEIEVVVEAAEAGAEFILDTPELYQVALPKGNLILVRRAYTDRKVIAGARISQPIGSVLASQ